MLNFFLLIFAIFVAIIGFSVALGIGAYLLTLYYSNSQWFAGVIGILIFLYFSRYFSKPKNEKN